MHFERLLILRSLSPSRFALRCVRVFGASCEKASQRPAEVSHPRDGWLFHAIPALGVAGPEARLGLVPGSTRACPGRSCPYEEGKPECHSLALRVQPLEGVPEMLRSRRSEVLWRASEGCGEAVLSVVSEPRSCRGLGDGGNTGRNRGGERSRCRGSEGAMSTAPM